jgi:hypothetical protein
MRVIVSAVPAGPSSAGVFAAYHDAGHAIAARVIAGRSALAPDLRPRSKGAAFEDWLNFVAAGHAAERELAGRSGLRWRQVVSNAGTDLESCYRLIHERTGEDHRGWILLHWTRAVARATRLLAANWDEVVRLAELDAPHCSLGGASGSYSWSGWWDEAIRRQRNDGRRAPPRQVARDCGWESSVQGDPRCGSRESRR